MIVRKRICSSYLTTQRQNGSEATDFNVSSVLRNFNRSLRSRSVVELLSPLHLHLSSLMTCTVIRAPFDLDIAGCAKYAVATFGSFNNRREGAGEIRGSLSHLIRY